MVKKAQNFKNVSSNTCHNGVPPLNTVYLGQAIFPHYGAISITIMCDLVAGKQAFPRLVRAQLSLAKLSLCC